jgi:uncharacterized protein YheU (UPF0270 family)
MQATGTTRNLSLNDEPHDPVVVPHAALAPDLLRGIVEAFILREGTDYGAQECSLEQKVTHVIRQLKLGEAQIVFDPNSHSVNIESSGKSSR